MNDLFAIVPASAIILLIAIRQSLTIKDTKITGNSTRFNFIRAIRFIG